MMEAEIQFCRLCLTTSVVYYSLLKSNGKEMVLSLTGLEIKDDDPSTESCAKCWLDLKLAYFIQQCFLDAEKKLTSTAPDPTIVKIEETIDIKVEEIADGDFEAKSKCNEVEDDINLSEDDDEYQELIFIQTEENNVEKKPLCICPICGMEYNDETELYCHISTHYNGPQQCDECPENVSNIQAYQEHIQTKHPQLYGATHICGICSLSFKYKSLYNLHLAGLHPQTAKTGKIKNVVTLTSLEDNDSPYQCGPCKKVFTNKRSHATHMKNHIKRICPVCGATVTRFSSHILTHTIKPVKCDICGKVCKHIESLKWHQYNTHKNLKKRTCDQCGKQFKKLYPFKLHMRTHSVGKGAICDICGKKFTTLLRLSKHIRIVHLKEFPHTCKYCDEAFAKKDSLQAHESSMQVASESEGGIISSTAGAHNGKESTSEHPQSSAVISRVSEEGSSSLSIGKGDICDICGKKFTTILSLNEHIKIVHLKEFPHACKDCDEAFATKDSLQAHERKHTNELPYVCEICFKGYTHNNTLQAHRKIHMPNFGN